MYPEFDELIAGIPARHRLAMTTNLSLANPKSPIWQRFECLTFSYHPSMMDEQARSRFWFVAQAITRGNRIPATVNIVGHRDNLPILAEVKAKCQAYGLGFHLDPQGGIDPGYTPDEIAIMQPFLTGDRFSVPGFPIGQTPRQCSAGDTYLQILPDGSTYPCFGLRIPEYRGNFFTDDTLGERPRIECCAPNCGGCDYDAVFLYDMAGKLIKGGK
jgi:hypothetical protein